MEPTSSLDDGSWAWRSDMIQDLLTHLKDFKSERENDVANFELDSVYFYHQMRLRLAQKYASRDFGPVTVTSVSRETIVGMSDDEVVALRDHVISEESATQMGYDRVRDKITEMRDEYESYVHVPLCTDAARKTDSEPLLLQEMEEIWGINRPLVIGDEDEEEDEKMSDCSVRDIVDSSSAADIADDISSTDGEEKQPKKNIGERLLHRLEYFWDHGFLGAI